MSDLSVSRPVEAAQIPGTVDILCQDAGGRVRMLAMVPHPHGCALVAPPAGTARLTLSGMRDLMAALSEHYYKIESTVPEQRRVGA
ncbi:hypothetical protein JOF53_006505 [Crossiella equi]|uniref:DUF1652 domain-containing protein n=1 Tax=Crossiella equi TaxID=130796 RepID=A0ABS5AM49_9PSEU|nr:hypothetical protein [Crossiella equi]MBP2477633.1 hypothetical protein [Crossiella equi]